MLRVRLSSTSFDSLPGDVRIGSRVDVVLSLSCTSCVVVDAVHELEPLDPMGHVVTVAGRPSTVSFFWTLNTPGLRLVVDETPLVRFDKQPSDAIWRCRGTLWVSDAPDMEPDLRSFPQLWSSHVVEKISVDNAERYSGLVPITTVREGRGHDLVLMLSPLRGELPDRTP